MDVLRGWLGPLDAYRQASRLRTVLDRIEPDMVHAMRIPFEAVLATAALAERPTPLLVSVWGNDFTLHAEQSAAMRWVTRAVMRRCDGLHPDCVRDYRLASSWGFSATKPYAVLPGNGGVDTAVFAPGAANTQLASRLHIPDGSPIVINPRGIRPYVRADTFFRSIPRVLADEPRTVFLCLGMAGNLLAQGWVRKLGIAAAVRLLPIVSPVEVADMLRASSISVSPSEHDGTPNTLLEAMACGCFPIAGDIESVREWITSGQNGLLLEPGSPSKWAAGIVAVLRDAELRRRAARANRAIVIERADAGWSMTKAVGLYHRIRGRRDSPLA
jgi:glycosyltransferase involved in cell wall biosynthesis